MIARLTALVEDEVVNDGGTTPETVVEVDTRTWPIESDVVVQIALASLRLQRNAIET